jgi:hypothetical protein
MKLHELRLNTEVRINDEIYYFKWIDWMYGKWEDVICEPYTYWTAGSTLIDLWIKIWKK